MSHLVSRILLAVFLIPAAALVYILVWFFFAESVHIEVMSNVIAGLVTWAFIAGYWTLLWHGSMQWTTRRIVWTLGAIPILAIAASLLAIATDQIVPYSRGMFGAFCGSMFAPIAWLTATVFLWRETAQERRARVSSSSTKAITCPTCGYNLTGLTATRCPECGKQCTLDELFAAQEDAVQRDVEN